MRTTLTLDPDVAAKAKAGAAQLGKPFKEVVNAARRLGLEQVLTPPASKPYRTRPRPTGLRRGFNYDNIGELLACAEGEALEHNCVLHSTDTDFARFPGLKWENPVAPA
jgi:hypothetical protein